MELNKQLKRHRRLRVFPLTFTRSPGFTVVTALLDSSITPAIS